jgi:rSAM/selenodomain-associated transferase 2
MLSIVIPALNEAANLERLLPELARTCREAELIVVDGGSTDGTQDVVRRFSRVALIQAERGRARQMNAGARVATGHALLFLHADTTLPSGAQTAILDALRDPMVVGGRFDVRFDNPRPVFKLIATMMNIRSRLSGISTGDQGIFVRRDTYGAMGGYAAIPLMEDIEFSRRLKRQGRLACLRLRVTTSARKWEREGALHTIVLMWTLRLLYAVGIRPARLHRWYYGGHTDGSAGARRSPNSGNPRKPASTH